MLSVPALTTPKVKKIRTIKKFMLGEVFLVATLFGVRFPHTML